MLTHLPLFGVWFLGLLDLILWHTDALCQNLKFIPASCPSINEV